MFAWFASCSLQAAVLLAASWCGAALLRHHAASARHLIWTLGVVGAVVVPLLGWIAPLALPAFAGTSSVDGPAVLVAPHASTAPVWPMWLAAAWVTGAVVVALHGLRHHLAARRLVRSASPVLALTTRVPLLRSEHIGSPMTVGIVRPRVLLPAAADTWSPARLRAVLVHELGHVARRDTLVQLIAQLACAIYWWNPLAWLAAARLRIEREYACDDLVLATGVLPSSYAADLLDVARTMSSHAHAGIGMVDRSWTETRLRHILDAARPRRLPRGFGLVVALGVVVMLACSSSPPPVTSAPSTHGTLVVGMPSLRDQPPSGAPYVQNSFTVRRPSKIDLSLVTAEVNRRLAALEDCYARQLAKKPGLSGTVAIHWTILETGDVPESCITEDTVHDDEIAACVNKLVLAGGFPAPHGGSIDVAYPFVFTAAK